MKSPKAKTFILECRMTTGNTRLVRHQALSASNARRETNSRSDVKQVLGVTEETPIPTTFHRATQRIS